MWYGGRWVTCKMVIMMHIFHCSSGQEERQVSQSMRNTGQSPDTVAISMATVQCTCSCPRVCICYGRTVGFLTSCMFVTKGRSDEQERFGHLAKKKKKRVCIPANCVHTHQGSLSLSLFPFLDSPLFDSDVEVWDYEHSVEQYTSAGRWHQSQCSHRADQSPQHLVGDIHTSWTSIIWQELETHWFLSTKTTKMYFWQFFCQKSPKMSTRSSPTNRNWW